MIAALSETTRTVLHVVMWPFPYVATVLACGGLLLFGAKVAKIEKRSYLRSTVIVAIGLGLAMAADPLYRALGLSMWVSMPINHVFYFAPVPIVFKAGIGKSLLAYVIAFALTGVMIAVLYLVG